MKFKINKELELEIKITFKNPKFRSKDFEIILPKTKYLPERIMHSECTECQKGLNSYASWLTLDVYIEKKDKPPYLIYLGRLCENCISSYLDNKILSNAINDFTDKLLDLEKQKELNEQKNK